MYIGFFINDELFVSISGCTYSQYESIYDSAVVHGINVKDLLSSFNNI
jgi:hypothetical protein